MAFRNDELKVRLNIDQGLGSRSGRLGEAAQSPRTHRIGPIVDTQRLQRQGQDSQQQRRKQQQQQQNQQQQQQQQRSAMASRPKTVVRRQRKIWPQTPTRVCRKTIAAQ